MKSLLTYLKNGFLLCMVMSSLIAQPKSLHIIIDQAITPPVSEYLISGIKHANENNYDSIVLSIDTPGGLYTTTRSMGQAILTSNVPVITYVSPQGARAASAGTFILYASHLAAMAPGTHLGSATPISIGPNEEQASSASENKIMEDTRAYIRSLAQFHGRSESFGLAAVNEAKSLTAKEAIQNNVIEVIATNIQELLDKADGQKVRSQNGIISLDTSGATIDTYSPTLKQQILFAITDPNITYLLLMAGIYGLMIELFNPGSIIPGVIGAVCLIIAGYSLHILPINYAGLALIALGVAFLITEAIIPSFGIFGFMGIVALGFGSFFMFDGIEWAQPSIWVILSLITLLSIGSFYLIQMNIRTHRRQPVSGIEGLVNRKAKVISIHDDYYTITVMGEAWRARCDQPLTISQQVKVIGFEGLTAIIEPLEKTDV